MAWDPRAAGPALSASSEHRSQPSPPDPSKPISSPAPAVPNVSGGAEMARPTPPPPPPAAPVALPPALAPGRPLEPLHGDLGRSALEPSPWAPAPDFTIIAPSVNSKQAAPDWGPTSLGLSATTAAGMSYLGWWLTGLLIYFNERRNWYVRFHALQSVLFTGALTIVSVVGYVASSLLMDVFLASHQLAFQTLAQGLAVATLLVVVGAWLTPLIAAYCGFRLRIPFIAPYAERYAAPFPSEAIPPRDE